MEIPFDPPTEHYDEQIKTIDEQMCELIKKRKEISNNNPGVPPLEYIATWAKKYELYEGLLRGVFYSLRNEERFRPIVKPMGFRKNLPVLKSVEKDYRMYTVPFIRQYDNASVVKFNVDWDTTDGTPGDPPEHFFELLLEEQYDCRMEGGGGSTGHYTFDFIVSPPLPDDISGIDLVFKEYRAPFKGKPTGHEIIVHLE